jgi:hypothetical protein
MARKEDVMKVLKTKDYDKFILVNGNRDIKHVKKIKKAIETNGNLMDYFPVVCSKVGQKLKVLDGQGRVQAAKLLGLSVSYVVAETITEDMIGPINSVPTIWSTKNYVNWYADRSYPAYVELRKFINETGVPVTVALQLVTGAMSDGGVHQKVNEAFKNGEMHIKDMNHAYKVANVISLLKKHGIAFATSRSLVLALNRLCKVELFDIERFDKKLEYQTGRFTKCAEFAQYIQMIDEIYNYRSTSSQLVSLAMEVKKNGDWNR